MIDFVNSNLKYLYSFVMIY